jgi:exosome complex component CSL4
MATADPQLPSLAYPGITLGPATRYTAGPGTHVHDGQIIASLIGQVSITESSSSSLSTSATSTTSASTPVPVTAGPQKRLTRITTPAIQGQQAHHHHQQQQQQQQQQTQADTNRSLPTISVTRRNKAREVLPQVGNTVLCRVMRLTPRQAIVAIHQVGDTSLHTEWQGVIRTQDVRATEKDRVRIQESFRPGDVVLARVISLGDQSNYYLSTASNELGVIMAKSKDGNDMVPMSWKEFWDPTTGATEPRKAAKP